MRTENPNVYHYDEYRAYLADYYAWNKARNPAFSHRWFSAQAGLKSYNYLKLVIDGERRLTRTFIGPFCKALRFSPQESAYFGKLVEFNSESDPGRKAARLDELLKLRSRSKLKLVSEKEQVHLFQHWYYVPLVELTQTDGFINDVRWIARRLGVDVQTAREAVDELVAGGFLERKNGTLMKVNRIADSTDEVPNLAIRRYHSRNLSIAAHKIFEQSVAEREYGSVTFMINAEKLARIKERMKSFRQELFSILDEPSPEGREVYQFGFQLFRMTEPAAESEKSQPMGGMEQGSGEAQ